MNPKYVEQNILGSLQLQSIDCGELCNTSINNWQI